MNTTEFTHFTWSQVSYLMTRMRSAAKGSSYMKCSMNPDKTHFVLDWVQPYLDNDGYPIRSLSGKIRWFVMKGGVMHSAWEREEILKEFPLDVPKTYTFISGDIDDNPILDFIEPSYRSTLENNTPVNVARLRYGNWYAMPEGSNFFSRDWVTIVEQPPLNAKRIRSWDLAATLPSEINPNPDWTAGVKVSKDLKSGIYYIEHVERFRDRPAGVEEKLMKVAENDGYTTGITVPQDPGAAGKSYATDLIRKFAERGYRCRTKPTNKDKATRFAPFSAAAEAGLVCVVRGDWNEKYFTELETFTGDGKGKDDQVDATADAFITLAETKTCPVPNMSGSGEGLYKKNQLSGIR